MEKRWFWSPRVLLYMADLCFVLAVRLFQKYVFSLVHHVTFVTVRQPSFMGLLGFLLYLAPSGDSFILDVVRY